MPNFDLPQSGLSVSDEGKNKEVADHLISTIEDHQKTLAILKDERQALISRADDLAFRMDAVGQLMERAKRALVAVVGDDEASEEKKKMNWVEGASGHMSGTASDINSIPSYGNVKENKGTNERAGW